MQRSLLFFDNRIIEVPHLDEEQAQELLLAASEMRYRQEPVGKGKRVYLVPQANELARELTGHPHAGPMLYYGSLYEDFLERGMSCPSPIPRRLANALERLQGGKPKQKTNPVEPANEAKTLRVVGG